ncbi:MAG: hypothetical protein F9K46_17850, partial [Anaerolineae bacterium]
MSISESLDTTHPIDIPEQRPPSPLEEMPEESHKERFRQIVQAYMTIEEDDLATAPAAKRTALVFR